MRKDEKADIELDRDYEAIRQIPPALDEGSERKKSPSASSSFARGRTGSIMVGGARGNRGEGAGANRRGKGEASYRDKGAKRRSRGRRAKMKEAVYRQSEEDVLLISKATGCCKSRGDWFLHCFWHLYWGQELALEADTISGAGNAHIWWI